MRIITTLDVIAAGVEDYLAVARGSIHLLPILEPSLYPHG